MKSTTQELNLYQGTVDGDTVLVCQQVDDFAIACTSTDVADKVIATINKHATTENQGIGIRTKAGMHSCYNGVDVHQTRDYIKLSCETYICRVLQTHGWETPGANKSDCHDSVPLAPDFSKTLGGLIGPQEGTAKHLKLEKQVGYTYCQVLGELIYTYTVCRVDIGYAATLLSHFSHAPALEHYKALKGVIKYLHRTTTWGIMYWRPHPVASLPHVPPPEHTVDPTLPAFPRCEFLRLVGYLDAAHATGTPTRRSVSGYVFTLAGGAVAYKSRRQPSVATSLTEAEFIAAVSAAKVAKYLCSVLHKLGFTQLRPTPLYVDNQAAIAMVNERRPTACSRHINIQHFAIQEWLAAGDIIMRHILGIINPSDQTIKALGWTLHSRHVCRSMGHHGCLDLSSTALL